MTFNATIKTSSVHDDKLHLKSLNMFNAE